MGGRNDKVKHRDKQESGYWGISIIAGWVNQIFKLEKTQQVPSEQAAPTGEFIFASPRGWVLICFTRHGSGTGFWKVPKSSAMVEGHIPKMVTCRSQLFVLQAEGSSSPDGPVLETLHTQTTYWSSTRLLRVNLSLTYRYINVVDRNNEAQFDFAQG